MREHLRVGLVGNFSRSRNHHVAGYEVDHVFKVLSPLYPHSNRGRILAERFAKKHPELEVREITEGPYHRRMEEDPRRIIDQPKNHGSDDKRHGDRYRKKNGVVQKVTLEDQGACLPVKHTWANPTVYPYGWSK